jgi:phosphopantetheine adenylyltransferase
MPSPLKDIGDDIIKRSDVAYFVFGRFNPPHRGHKEMVDILIEKAGAAGADPYVFATSTQNDKRDPLFVDEKVEILKRMYPKVSQVRIINTTKSGCKTIPAVIGRLKDAGYKRIVLVAGGARVADFTGKFEVEKGQPLEVVNGGERDPDAEDPERAGTAAGYSASKMRSAVKRRDWNTFRAGLNETIGSRSAERLMEKIATRLKGGTRRRRSKTRKN